MESTREVQRSGSESKKEVNTIAWLCSQSEAKVHKMLGKKKVTQ